MNESMEHCENATVESFTTDLTQQLETLEIENQQLSQDLAIARFEARELERRLEALDQDNRHLRREVAAWRGAGPVPKAPVPTPNPWLWWLPQGS